MCVNGLTNDEQLALVCPTGEELLFSIVFPRFSPCKKAQW